MMVTDHLKITGRTGEDKPLGLKNAKQVISKQKVCCIEKQRRWNLSQRFSQSTDGLTQELREDKKHPRAN